MKNVQCFNLFINKRKKERKKIFKNLINLLSRLLKHYELNFHVLPNSLELIPGRIMSMSSYAGKNPKPV